MQVPNQNNPQISSTGYCNCCNTQPAYAYYPQQQTYAITPPNNANGCSQAPAVNIQIINPALATPGSAPTYNVNAPSYPANYYTQQLGQVPNGNGYNSYPNSTNPNGSNNGNGVNGNNQPNNAQGANGTNQNENNTNGTNGNTQGANGNNTNSTDGNNNQSNNVNGQNNNPNGNSTSSSSNTETTTSTEKNTEKRKIIQLDDDYIRTLENHLNNRDKNVRLAAAKEVMDRIAEDESRHDDKALTALINKMLQDPSQEIRILALSAVESRMIDGDSYTANVLQKMQQSKKGYGQDAIDATNALLKMAGKPIEKEFEVKKTTKKENTKETKSEKK